MQTQIIFSRGRHDWLNFLPILISVNDEKLGALQKGQTLVYTLPSKVQYVYLKLRCGFAKSIFRFKITDKEQIEFNIIENIQIVRQMTILSILLIINILDIVFSKSVHYARTVFWLGIIAFSIFGKSEAFSEYFIIEHDPDDAQLAMTSRY